MTVRARNGAFCEAHGTTWRLETAPGGMRIGNADEHQRAIGGQPELKALLSPAEVSALEVATGRKLP